MLIGHNGSESSAEGSTVEPPRLRGSFSLSLILSVAWSLSEQHKPLNIRRQIELKVAAEVN